MYFDAVVVEVKTFLLLSIRWMFHIPKHLFTHEITQNLNYMLFDLFSSMKVRRIYIEFNFLFISQSPSFIQ